MDWTEDSEGTKGRLMRVVALLLALATLAERAGRASLAMRVLAMGFLRPAEEVAWNFVAGGRALPAGESDDPASAMRLAGRFRALAVVLAAFAGRFGGCSRLPIGILATAAEAALDFTGLDRGRPQPFDTS